MTMHERDDLAMTALSIDSADLSPAGQARRDAILSLLLRAQNGRIRRRRTIRAATVFAVVALGGGAAYVGATRGPVGGGASRISGTTVRHAEGSAASGSVILTASLVHADASILDRVAVRRDAAAPIIGDDELAELLREAGREAGIVRIGGRAVLASELTPPAARDIPTGPSGRVGDRAGPAAG